MGNLRTAQFPGNCDMQFGKSWIYDAQGSDTVIFRRVFRWERLVP